MKNKNGQLAVFVSAVSLLILAFMPVTTHAQDDPTLKGIGITAGYRTLKPKGSGASFVHDTHPADGFLPGSAIPGSAGKTGLDGQLQHFGTFGVRYQTLFVPTVSCDIEAGGLFGRARDYRQNANDPRPPSSGSFVYSEANYGFYGALGASYHFQKVLKGGYLGVETQANCFFVDHGYSRFGRDESVRGDLLVAPSVGPKFGYNLDNMFIELTVQFGRSVGGGISFGMLF